MKIHKDNIDNIVDSLGKEIDPLIKNMVILLNRNGITTMASCEGHLDYGEHFPWVDFEYPCLNKFIRLLEDYECSGHIHIMFLKDYHSKKITCVRMMPEQKSLIKGREQFNNFESFLSLKIK